MSHLLNDLRSALQDNNDNENSVLDVTLVGSDGGRVKANKSVLAMRSPVFCRMFFGNFQERDSHEIAMPQYPAFPVLQMVVHYCFTDELNFDLIRMKRGGDNETEPPVEGLTDGQAVALVQVRDAADYLELKMLHETVSEEFVEKVDKASICAVLQELVSRNGGQGALFESFLDRVQAEPQACLLPTQTTHHKGVVACSWTLLEQIMGDPSLDMFVAVQALQKWHQAHGEEEEGSLDKLQTLAQQMDLQEISLVQLAQIKPCPLFTIERLHEAMVFRSQNQTVAPPGDASSSHFATVRGAGLEEVNGVYHPGHNSHFGDAVVYQRPAKYGDLDGAFVLRLKSYSTLWRPWQLSFEHAHPDASFGVQTFVLYESTTAEVGKMPFAKWKCVDGHAPTPYVSVHKKGSNNAGSESSLNSSSVSFNADTTFGGTRPSGSGFQFNNSNNNNSNSSNNNGGGFFFNNRTGP